MKPIKILMLLAIQLMILNLVSVEINELKSAYIEKFTRFIEWPDNQLDDEFTIGYILNDEFADNLIDFFSSNQIKNKKVAFKQIKSLGDTIGCDIIYLPECKCNLADNVIRKCRSNQILLISHSDFYNHDVHLNFFIENNRLKFESNPKAFRESGLKVSYHLLRLSRIVRNN